MKELSIITGFIVLVFVVILIQPMIIYCLWDDTMVKFFNLKDVTFMDSVWISIISSVLFKSSRISTKKG